MPITANNPAPYTAPAAVIEIIERFRDKGLTTPITTDVLARAGVPESLAPRTMTSLKLLELLDEANEPTEHLQTLRSVTSAQYDEVRAAWLRDVYAEVFSFVDPKTDDLDRVSDAFRAFTPQGQRARMVTLFLGLCAWAGITNADVPKTRPRPAPPKKAKQNGAPEQASRPATTRAPERAQEQSEPERAYTSPPPHPSQGHPLLDGLFAALPEVGSAWAEEDREAWTRAALANFSLVYKLPQRVAGGDSD